VRAPRRNVYTIHHEDADFAVLNSIWKHWKEREEEKVCKLPPPNRASFAYDRG